MTTPRPPISVDEMYAQSRAAQGLPPDLTDPEGCALLARLLDEIPAAA